jgi:hypothetical protein
MNRILPLLILVALLGCKKDNSTSDLLSKSWRLNARTILTPGNAVNWFHPGTCRSDMIWTYKSNGDFLMEPSGSCISGTSTLIDTVFGKWTLIDNKTIRLEPIATGLAFEAFEFKITRLTSSQLVVLRSENNSLDGRAGGGGYRASTDSDVLVQYEFVPK